MLSIFFRVGIGIQNIQRQNNQRYFDELCCAICKTENKSKRELFLVLLFNLLLVVILPILKSADGLDEKREQG